MAAIALQQVHKAYPDGAAVIRDLSMDIHDGEFMVMVGPSGCGKSTTLRMIAGLEALSSGSLRIGTRVVNDLAPKDRDVAMVFQSYALYPHMTVRDNIAFGLQVRKLPADEIKRRVDAAADTLGLVPELDRKPRALSGGQRQRVALGRALVRQPAVFLFDEPLSNLDAELRVHMRAELCRLQRRLATTAVYVTHDQTEALTMGHRIAVLRPCGNAPGLGNLTQVGTPHEVYHRPANLFTARFIGTPRMNLLPALLGADGRRVLCLDHWLPVPPALWDATRPRAGQPVTLGLRAEHLRPAAELDAAEGVAIRAQVEIVEPLGHEALVYVELHGQHLAGRLRSVLGLPRPGEAIELMVQADAMHLFDPASEARLG